MGVYDEVMKPNDGLQPAGVESELRPADITVLPEDGGAFLPMMDEDRWNQNFASAEVAPQLPPAPTNPRMADRSTDIGGKTGQAVRLAQSLVGTPYVWGGTSTAGFDCSGLVQYVYQKAYGINLPRISSDQARAGKRIGLGKL